MIPQGAADILFDLRFRGEDDLAGQLARHLEYEPDAYVEMLWALYLLSDGWPEVEGLFRALVSEYADAWLGEMQILPATERYIAALKTSRLLGLPLPEVASRVCNFAGRLLVQRGREAVR